MEIVFEKVFFLSRSCFQVLNHRHIRAVSLLLVKSRKFSASLNNWAITEQLTHDRAYILDSVTNQLELNDSRDDYAKLFELTIIFLEEVSKTDATLLNSGILYRQIDGTNDKFPQNVAVQKVATIEPSYR